VETAANLLMAALCHVEWYFRSSLDRYIWIFGMLCAWAHPFADKALNAIDEMSIRSRMIARSLIFGITAALFAVWCALTARPDKLFASPACLVHLPLRMKQWAFAVGAAAAPFRNELTLLRPSLCAGISMYSSWTRSRTTSCTRSHHGCPSCAGLWCASLEDRHLVLPHVIGCPV